MTQLWSVRNVSLRFLRVFNCPIRCGSVLIESLQNSLQISCDFQVFRRFSMKSALGRRDALGCAPFLSRFCALTHGASLLLHLLFVTIAASAMVCIFLSFHFKGKTMPSPYTPPGGGAALSLFY